jgi:steroid 5-alpha reductase family enzyme
MSRFKADPANQGKLIDVGLWRYTRHPNYFGDACLWTGVYLVAAEHWPGMLTIVSPVLMTFLLAFGTGKRLLEESMAKRPGYAEYMRRTSGFIPLPRKPASKKVGS